MRDVGTWKALAVLMALSFVVEGDVLATPLPGKAPASAVSSDDVTQTIARRRAQKRAQKKRRGRQAEKPAEEAPAAGEQAPAAKDAAVDSATQRGPTRVEFDERLLQGQTNKANAIYLFQRRESALRSLVKKRRHFHDEIDEALE